MNIWTYMIFATLLLILYIYILVSDLDLTAYGGQVQITDQHTYSHWIENQLVISCSPCAVALCPPWWLSSNVAVCIADFIYKLLYALVTCKRAKVNAISSKEDEKKHGSE